jgi:excinuclease ABC subunit C
MTRSVLDDVPGIGPKRRDALLAHFSSVEQLRAAGLDELASIPGVGRSAALALKAFLAEEPPGEPAGASVGSQS